jgi:hypothetical protein
VGGGGKGPSILYQVVTKERELEQDGVDGRRMSARTLHFGVALKVHAA